MVNSFVRPVDFSALFLFPLEWTKCYFSCILQRGLTVTVTLSVAWMRVDNFIVVLFSLAPCKM